MSSPTSVARDTAVPRPKIDCHGVVFSGKYQAKECLAVGDFGEIWAVNVLFCGPRPLSRLIVKVEVAEGSRLRSEYKIYQKLQGLACIPKVHTFDEQKNIHGLVMTYVGVSVQEMWSYYHKAYHTEEAKLCGSIIMEDLIKALQAVHSRGIIHCDLKPSNIMYALTEQGEMRITLIDFGGSVIEGECPQYFGNEYFASIRRLKNPDLLPTKVDDLISVGYILIYMANRMGMRWDSQFDIYSQNQTKATFSDWLAIKEQTTPELLALGLPKTYLEFLIAIFSLAPNDTPDYDRYADMFKIFVAKLESE